MKSETILQIQLFITRRLTQEGKEPGGRRRENERIGRLHFKGKLEYYSLIEIRTSLKNVSTNSLTLSRMASIVSGLISKL